jgi:hypothetical protein
MKKNERYNRSCPSDGVGAGDGDYGEWGIFQPGFAGGAVGSPVYG